MKFLQAHDFRRAFAYVGTLVLCLAFLACETDDPITPPPPEDATVMELIDDRGDLQEFAALIPDDLRQQLDDPDNEYTVFAPNDAAFAGVALENVPEEEVGPVVEYHVVEGTFAAADLSDGQTLTTVGGDQLEVSLDDEGNVFIDGAQVTASDEADNGIVHVVDQVLLGNRTAWERINWTQETQEFAFLIEEVGMVEDFDDPGVQWTVHAPNNAAVGAVDTGVFEEEDLVRIVNYHVVDDQVLTSGEIEDGQTVTTREGSEATYSVTNGQVSIEGANVVTADLSVANGIVHHIDQVIAPEDLRDQIGEPDNGDEEQTVLDVIAEREDLSDFYQAIVDNNLEDELAQHDALTAFAPDNDAFAEVDLTELDEEEIQSILLNHFAEGTVMAADLQDGDTINTLAGGELEVSIEDDNVFIDGATVIEADIEADNGVIHVIDTVLPAPDNGDDDNDDDNGDNDDDDDNGDDGDNG